MSLSNFKQVLDQLAYVQEIMLQGLGEPLLNPAFEDIVHEAKKRNIRVGTTTNGTLLTPQLAQGFIDAGLDLMSISIDGTTAETYERIRRGADFECVIENVRRMNELKQARHASLPKLNIGYILTNHNYHQIPDLVRLASNLGVEEINVWQLQGGDTYGDIGALELEATPAVKESFTAAKALAEDKYITLTLPPLKRVYNVEGCLWPWRGIYVTWDGFVTPCCIMCYPEILNFGNVFEQDVEHIWHSSAYQRFRRQLLNETPPRICQGCPYEIAWMAELQQR